jgi:hypothetical protein
VQGTNEKRDALLSQITNVTNDLCGTILRLEETHHVNLVGRLKADVETYAAYASCSSYFFRFVTSLSKQYRLVKKAHAGVTAFDGHKRVFRVWARNELGSELSALDRELDSFAARFRASTIYTSNCLAPTVLFRPTAWWTSPLRTVRPQRHWTRFMI